MSINPLWVIPAVSTEKGIKFLHDTTQYEIKSHVDTIWTILEECNGHQSIKQVVRRSAKRVGHASADLLQGIVDDLLKLGILVDGREAYRHFHRLSSNPMPYFRNLSNRQVKVYTRSPRLPCKSGEALLTEAEQTNLVRLQAERYSCRNFLTTPLLLKQIGHVLTASYSLKGRTVPSAGGLYSLKIYVIVFSDQEDFSTGYYEYDPEKLLLHRYANVVDKERLEYAFNSDDVLYGAPVAIVIAADLQRHPGKYSNRGYRFTLLEAGHVAQNIHLAGVEQRLNTLEYGGFYDDVLARELQLDTNVLPLITIGLGYGRAEKRSTAADQLEELRSQIVGRGKPVTFVRSALGGNIAKGETFFSAVANYRASPYESARTSYRQRFTHGTASNSDTAQVKAIAEAYERFASGCIRVDREACAKDLSERWIDPRKAVPYTAEQLAGIADLQNFDETKLWHWVEGKDLTDGSRVWVSVDLVFYPLKFEAIGRKPCYFPSSNGVAAFTNKTEATSRALLELVERDCLMRHWLMRKVPYSVPAGLVSPRLQKKIHEWEARGRRVYILDHSDFGVAVAGVFLVNEQKFPCVSSGAAASLDSFDAAVTKALHEAELGLFYTSAAKPHKKIQPEEVELVADHSKLYAYPDHLDAIRWLWQGEERKEPTVSTTSLTQLYVDLEAVAIQLSSHDAPLHVVRVVAEKLVPINFGFGTEHFSHEAMRGKVHPESLRFPHYFA
ncbi:MAG: YcaO-like family protein [Candidatus Saccharimonadales bacterium]